MSPENWTAVDSLIDKVLRNLRAVHQDVKASETSLVSLIDKLNSLDTQQST
jgi:hypothetical protein